MDPEVLLIDEVLAVGDEAFTRKCLDKIGEFRRRGKTILIVTHSLGLVEKMCDDVLWLRRGKVEGRGDPKRVVDHYLTYVAGGEEHFLAGAQGQAPGAPGPAPEAGPGQAESRHGYREGRWGAREVEITAVRLLDAHGKERHVYVPGESLTLALSVRAEQPVEDFVFGIGLFTTDGVSVYGTNTHIEDWKPRQIHGAGRGAPRAQRSAPRGGHLPPRRRSAPPRRHALRLSPRTPLVPRQEPDQGRGRLSSSAPLVVLGRRRARGAQAPTRARTRRRVAPVGTGRVEKLLFVLLLGSYAYFYQSVGHNEAARFDLTRALLEDHSVAVDRFRQNSADLVVHAGRTYSNKAPGASLLALAPFWLAGVLLKPLGLPEWEHWDAVAWLTTLATVGLLSALAGVALFRLAHALTGSAFAAALAALAFGLGSIAFPFATLFFGHQIAAALLVFAFTLVFQRRHAGKAAARPRSTWFAAGLFVAYAVVTEYPAAIPAAGVSLYALDTLRREGRRWRAGVFFGLGVAPAAAVLGAYNLAAFGRVFFASYQAYVGEGSAAIYKAHAQGFVGVHWPGLTAFGRVLAELTVLPRRGLFFLNPILSSRRSG